MRRSAVDIGAPGFDNASGYGLLNIPNALSFRTPPRDPQEPNEDPAEIEPHGLFAAGTEALTRPGHLTAFLTAHVDRNEDPVDLYRVWSPAREVLHVRLVGAVTARVLPRAPRTSKTRPLAVGKRRAVAYRNQHMSGTYVYVEIRPVTRAVEYRLHITAARR
jgi:hypothetical protein